MSLGDIVDGAFRLYRANFRTIFIIIAVVSGPVQLISALAQRNTLGGRGIIDLIHNPTTTQSSSSSSNAAALLAALISVLLLPFAAGAVSRVVSASYLGTIITPGEALKASGRRFFPLFFAWILIHLLEAFGLVLLILPAFLFMALCMATAPAIVMEELGPLQGIRRSWRLNRPRMWSVLGIALLSGLMVSFIGDIFAVPLDGVAFAIGLHWGWILLFLGSWLANLVVLSLTAIISTLIYFDGRIRNEGFDLQILARGIGQ